MKIIISKMSVGSKRARKKFVASTYDALRGLLSGEKLEIEIGPDVDLPVVCSAIRGIAGIIDVGSDAISGAPEEEEEPDDGESWKA